MQPKSLQKLFLVLGIVLLVLIAAFLIIYFTLIQSSSPEEPEDEKIQLWSVEPSKILSFSYDYQGENYAFVRKNGPFYLQGESDDFPLNQALFFQPSGDCMLYKCMEFSLLRKVLEDCSDLQKYGLQTPSLTLYIRKADGEETIYFGNRYAQSERRYCMRKGDSALYLIEESYFTAFAYTKTELLNHPTHFSETNLILDGAAFTDDNGSHPLTDAQQLNAFAQELRAVRFKGSNVVDYYAADHLAQYGLEEGSRRLLSISYYDSEEDQSNTEVQPNQYTIYLGKTEGDTVYFASPQDDRMVYALSLTQYQELMQFFSL